MIDFSDIALLRALSIGDWLAVAWLFAAMAGLTWWIEVGPRAHESVASLMMEQRRAWMRVAAGRDGRIFDASLLSSLQGGASFLASACMIAVGGVVALLGRAEDLATVAQDVAGAAAASRALWEARLLLLLGLLTYGFFKFAWAQRLFGYQAVLLGAIPEVKSADEAARLKAADKAAAVNITAARSFNRGLRGVYFTLGALGWFFGAGGLFLSTIVVGWAIYRREFRSSSRAAIAGEEPK